MMFSLYLDDLIYTCNNEMFDGFKESMNSSGQNEVFPKDGGEAGKYGHVHTPIEICQRDPHKI